MAMTKAFLRFKARLEAKPLFWLAGPGSHIACQEHVPPTVKIKKLTAREAWNYPTFKCDTCGYKPSC